MRMGATIQGAGRWAIAISLMVVLPPTADAELRLTPAVSRVGRYQCAELRIEGVPHVANPFDPAQADVTIEVRTPAGKRIQIPAFYVEPFEIRPLRRDGREMHCFHAVGVPGWRARYAPVEPGTHTVMATARIGGNVLRSPAARVQCSSAPHSGHVRVSQRDPRFLETEDGKPFFVIGQNVAFVKDTFEWRDYLGRLAENGVNYVRVWTCCDDWGMSIEGRKSLWSRTWMEKPVLTPYPTGGMAVTVPQEGLTVHPTQRIAMEPNAEYIVSVDVRSDSASEISVELPGRSLRWTFPVATGPNRQERAFRTGSDAGPIEAIRLQPSGGAVQLRNISLKSVRDGRELLFDADPSAPVLGRYHQPDCAMLDRVIADAERLGVRLQLCVLVRDLYMDRLRDPGSRAYGEAMRDARNLLRYAMARWGWSTSVAAWEYWNEMDPGVPTERFYSEVGDYLRSLDPRKRPRTTSAWADAPRDWRHPSIDVPNMHWYMRPAEGVLYDDAVQAVLTKAAFLRSHAPDRPALFAEFGVATDDWRENPDGERDRSFFYLHHGLWASALSGLSGTVMAWWWEGIHAREGYRRYAPLARFVSDIPWTTAGLKASSPTPSVPCVRVVGLQGAECAYLWLYDTRSPWRARSSETEPPPAIAGLRVKLSGLKDGSYRVSWFDTATGASRPAQAVTVRDGAVEIAAPEFRGDTAAKVERISRP